jgi:hypothetical protein
LFFINNFFDNLEFTTYATNWDFPA